MADYTNIPADFNGVAIKSSTGFMTLDKLPESEQAPCCNVCGSNAAPRSDYYWQTDFDEDMNTGVVCHGCVAESYALRAQTGEVFYRAM